MKATELGSIGEEHEITSLVAFVAYEMYQK